MASPFDSFVCQLTPYDQLDPLTQKLVNAMKPRFGAIGLETANALNDIVLSGKTSPLAVGSKTATITASSNTYTINSPGDVATASLLVIRNGIASVAGAEYTFNSSTHTWSFASPLSVGEILIFIYTKAA